MLVIVTTGVMAASALMQYGLAAVSPSMIDDFRLTNRFYGSLFTAYFGLCALLSLTTGRFLQRLGARHSMTLVTVTAGAALIAVGVSPSAYLIFPALLVSAVAGAAANPATNLAITGHPNRSVLIGVKQSGIQVSALLAGVALAPISAAVGWRISMLVFGGLTLAFLLPATLTVHAPPTSNAAEQPRTRRKTSTYGLAAFALLMGCGTASTFSYLPLYATNRLDLAQTQAGLLLALFGVSAIVGRVAWGILHAQDGPDRLWVMLALVSLGATFGTGLLLISNPVSTAFAYPGALLIGVTGAAWNSLAMAAVVERAHPGDTARASGHVMAGFFLGMALSPLLLGALLDHTHSFELTWLLTAALFAGGGAIALSVLNPHFSRGKSFQEVQT